MFYILTSDTFGKHFEVVPNPLLCVLNFVLKSPTTNASWLPQVELRRRGKTMEISVRKVTNRLLDDEQSET